MRLETVDVVRSTLAALLAVASIATYDGCSLGIDDIAVAGPDVLDGGEGARSNTNPDGTTAEAQADATAVGAFDQATSMEDAAIVPVNDAAPSDSGSPGDAGCARDSDCPQTLGKCLASVCQSGTCSTAARYGLLASQFTVPGTPLAARDAGSPAATAIAAAYPYVFVVTAAGVSAFDLTSPTDTSPPAVRIDNLTLPGPIVATVALGSTVYFVTGVSGPPLGAYQALAWIDVSVDVVLDGGAPSLQAHLASQLSIAPPTNQNPTSIDSLYNVLGNAQGGLFLIYYSADDPTYYPTASTLSHDNSATLVPYWNQALVTGAELAAASGSRLIAYESDSQQPKFALVTGAGTAAAQVGPQVTVPTPSAAQAAFASNPKGGVLWTSAPLMPVPTARLTLLAASSATTSLSAIGNVAPASYVDLEHYSTLPAASVVAPPIWVDQTDLALGLAADHADLSNTAAHVVSVSAGGLSATGGIVSLPLAGASTLGVASSNTFAYVLAPGTDSSKVYVLAPLCAP